jgi:tartrate-resistant acid phosphatase type 5
MRSRLILLIILPLLFLLNGCSKPKATVFKDQRLLQEEVVKFCFLGDVGQGTEFQEAIAESLKKEKCHRIAFLGDLVYPEGITSTEDPELYEKFLKYYSPLFEENPDLIVLLMLGNHDHQGRPGAWKNLFKQDERYFFPNYYYFIDYGGLCFVTLDTSFYFYKEQLTEAADQTHWLTELQPRLKECDVKVALSHHPFKGGDYPGSKDWEGAEGTLKTFLDTYVIGNFDIHIAGHVHVLADDGKDEGTRMLISGTGGENRGTGPSGYVILTWNPTNPKRIGYRLKEVDTQVYVYDESTPEEQEEKEHWDDNIQKSRLEENILMKIWAWAISKMKE